ncbi:polysaccharide biosynthesis tyrosine autokinase [Pontibacter sp. FD36]|uniref:GumC family protein n=1 Tax=Pontibacter sp. FD36 TaxID=2789860 RepID=UPI0018A98A0D|nr:polysaccharide biosynthesis tyrosine autokinase [Pontibacter sp. FD36]MBF8964675.1 polysaccharide biosynthesis tyrosine autokinase [Pontibacter sp. FD36]
MSNNNPNAEDNFFVSLAYKYLPYWPLFIILLVLSITGGWVYQNFLAIPSYEVTASMIIKDENKGVSESRITESMDNFTTNKVVENEINIIHSRSLLSKVVNDLHLYAPIQEEMQFKSVSAYTSSPIIIELKNPAEATEVLKTYFTVDNGTVTIDNKSYPINKWVRSPYGIVRFAKNPNMTTAATGPLYFTITNPANVTDELMAKIRIQALSKVSAVINLYLKDSVPQRGEDILNMLIASYKELAVRERSKLAANTLAFIEERIKMATEELEALENKVVQFKSTQGGVNLSEQGKLYLENVRDNDRKISEINTQLAVLSKVERYVQSENTSGSFVPSTLGVNDPSLNQLLQKLYDSEIQYQKLRNTTAENNPILVSITNEIENIRPRIIENIRNQRVNLQASRNNLSSTNSGYNNSLQSIPHKERELMELTRQQMVKNNAYNFLLQKREETVLSYAPTAEDSKVIDMAGTSPIPVSPKPLYTYLVSVIIACVLGLVLIAGKELLNSKILFRSEIALYTSAPIVAELSFNKNHKKGVFKAPSEVAVVEQFRQLRVTLGLYGRTFTKKKIMVTSSIPGEGKSYVSTNLALSLASSGKKVALLDLDLRNPNTSMQFNLYKTRGIIEYLSEGNITPPEIINETEFTNLSVLPAGTNVGDHTELLLNPKLEDLISYLELTYDYLIIDTPPVDLVSDAYLLSEYCDISLLVMRHAYTPKPLVQRLAHDNKIKSLNNVAIVFNGVKPRGFVKGQYGYGYGYGFEHKYTDKTYRGRGAAANA